MPLLRIQTLKVLHTWTFSRLPQRRQRTTPCSSAANSLPSLLICSQGLAHKRITSHCLHAAQSLSGEPGQLQQPFICTHFTQPFPGLPAPRKDAASRSHLGTAGSLRSTGSSPVGAGCRWQCCVPPAGSRCRSQSEPWSRAAAPSG